MAAAASDFWAEYAGLPSADSGRPEDYAARKRAAMAYAEMRKNGGSGYRYRDAKGRMMMVLFPDGVDGR